MRKLGRVHTNKVWMCHVHSATMAATLKQRLPTPSIPSNHLLQAKHAWSMFERCSRPAIDKKWPTKTSSASDESLLHCESMLGCLSAPRCATLACQRTPNKR